jgi:hypothetical protein
MGGEKAILVNPAFPVNLPEVIALIQTLGSKANHKDLEDRKDS